MTEPNTPTPRRTGALQTKALAGLVTIMIAAAIVALVFVVNGGGSDGSKQAGGQRDVAHTNSSSSSPTSSAKSTAAPTTSAAPSTSSAPSTSAAPSPTGSSSSTSTKPSSPSHAADAKKVVYTVKKGDTLTDIGRWYSDHGYLKLYDWNKSVIGQDPDLIFPGQKIIVVENHVGVARQAP